jgi:hypothetical protein
LQKEKQLPLAGIKPRFVQFIAYLLHQLRSSGSSININVLIKEMIKKGMYHTGRCEKLIHNTSQKTQTEESHLEVTAFMGIILKLILNKLDEMVWSGFIWLRTGPNDGL